MRMAITHLGLCPLDLIREGFLFSCEILAIFLRWCLEVQVQISKLKCQ
jgi:hypothetical protein